MGDIRRSEDDGAQRRPATGRSDVSAPDAADVSTGHASRAGVDSRVVSPPVAVRVDSLMTPLAEQWPYLRFLGFGAWWAWIWLCYNSTELMQLFPAEAQTSSVLEMYLISTLSIAASVFVFAAFWRRTTSLIDDKRFVVAGGALASLCTVLLGFSAVMGGGAYFVIASCLTGVGTSVLCLRAGRIYGSISLGDSLTAGGISLLFAAFLYFTGIGVPERARLFFIGALPLISALLLTMKVPDPFDADSTSAGESERGRQTARRMYRKLVAAAALVAFTAGVGKGISSMFGNGGAFAHNGSVTVALVGVLGVAVVVIVNRGDAVRGARQVYSLLIVMGIAMMLATCFGFDIAYLSIGKECLWMVFSCFMAYLAFRFDLSPVRVFGIGQGAYFVGSAAGWLVGGAVQPYYQDAMVRMAVGMALAFVVVVVLVYVFPENDLKRIMAKSVDSVAAEREAQQKLREAAPATCVGCTACSTHEGDPAGIACGVAEGVATGGRAAAARCGNVADSSSEASAASLDAPPASSGADLGSRSSASAAVAGNPADPVYGLSTRELEILDLFAQGRSAAWIAENLTISKNTVRTHLRAVYAKLDVHSRQELLDFLSGKRA